MKMKKAALIAGILGAVIIGSSITITQQNEYKLIRQFGKVDRVICEPGISFKIPLIERTQSLPKETLLYDLEASDVITKDKKTMISDSYVLWRITDPLKFAQTLNSSLENSESRINTAVYNATKNVISSLSQDRVITSRDGELSDMVMEAIGDNMEQYGIELIKFETKQLDLPDDNKAAVYERMISERDNIAATYKAEGDSEAKVIQNKTDKEVTIQISDAKKQAECLPEPICLESSSFTIPEKDIHRSPLSIFSIGDLYPHLCAPIENRIHHFWRSGYTTLLQW